ncbi:hypothetical protein CALCODRAFT_510191 [Calocera cornea HHB12733]|uniref:Uncharacterized protein n=1 Tax=Calocera cornea HHB12733 TaxID=1353952 RepID=A0A165EQ71_9BASI|nr:hypothetical protein CALCODRAFT_510191 [Calocera cornea HHB12733]
MVNFTSEERDWLEQRLAAYALRAKRRDGKRYASEITFAFQTRFPNYQPKKGDTDVTQQIYVFLKNNKVHMSDPLLKLRAINDRLPPITNQAREHMAADIPTFREQLATYALQAEKPPFQARAEFLKQYWDTELSAAQRVHYIDVAEKQRAESRAGVSITDNGARCTSEQIFATISSFHKSMQASTNWVLFTLAGGLDQSGLRTMTFSPILRLRVDTGKTSAGLSFSEFNVEHNPEVLRVWKEFVKSAVPCDLQKASTRVLPTLQRYENNCPILPSLDPAWNRLEIAVVLATFFRHLYAHESGDKPFDWASAAVKPGRLPATIVFSDPEEMTFVDLLTVYERVAQEQSEHKEEYTFFNIATLPSDAFMTKGAVVYFSSLKRNSPSVRYQDIAPTISDIMQSQRQSDTSNPGGKPQRDGPLSDCPYRKAAPVTTLLQSDVLGRDDQSTELMCHPLEETTGGIMTGDGLNVDKRK